MKYKKKPITIEAIQYNGNNKEEVNKFVGYKLREGKNNSLLIFTLEGDMEASVGDYIIRGVSNEVYPCKPDIFHKTYDPVEE